MSTLFPQKKIIVILPAYNAARTLRQTFLDIPKDVVDDVFLVDDASTDATVSVAHSLYIPTIVHKKNRGYGGNQKTCYDWALAKGADIVVMVHPDHQYDPLAIPELLRPLVEGRADAVFGSRMIVNGQARKGGMPWWKYFANMMLTAIENMALGLHLTEYHSGFRAYTREVLTAVPFQANSDDFVFDTEIIIQLNVHGFRIHEIPIATRYFKDASTIGFFRSVRYGCAVLLSLLKYWCTRCHIIHLSQFE